MSGEIKVEVRHQNGVREILEQKGLLEEVVEVLQSLPSLGRGTPKVIQGCLAAKGWELEKPLFPGTQYRQDAFKDRVMLEIDLRGSLLDAVHRNFLRAQVLYVQKKLDALIQIVELDREPRLVHMHRDTLLFQDVLTVPICLIGVGIVGGG